MDSFSDIIDLWPNCEVFARDLGLKRGSHARLMKIRNSIPWSHWPKLLKAAKRREISLTQRQLNEALRNRRLIKAGGSQCPICCRNLNNLTVA